MKKIVAILMAMLMVMSVTVVLASDAKDAYPGSDDRLIEVTQDKASQDIESTYDGEQIRIKCKFEKPIVERGEYDRVRVKSLRNLGKPGEPNLLFKTLNILLPQGKTVQSIEVTGNQFHLPGEYRVEHGQEPVPVGSKSKYRTPQNQTIYNSTAPYPSKLYTKASIQELRGYKILILNLYPTQYVPKAGRISYFDSMNVIVNTAPDTISGNFRGLPKDRARVLDVVDNPEVVETYETSPQPEPAENYDYLIITNSDLSNKFQTLADWKNDKGINTKVVTLDEIGGDTPEEIRNYIIAEYGKGVDYVLLGGDVEIIPDRELYVRIGLWYRYYIPSDLYYAGLDGTWDDDGDGRYGEPEEEDLYAEVNVGRAPVNTADDVSRFVNKAIEYEQSPSTDYLKNALMLAAKLDADTDGGVAKDKICATKIPEDWSVTKLYERYDNASVSATTEELNEGQHVVNNIGHANQYVIGLACIDYEAYYTISDVDNLQNAPKYFLFYTIGCYANAFDYSDCIGEHFVNNDNGAFAFIGNTRYGWYIPGMPGEGPSDKFDIEFFDALFVEGITNIGTAFQDSKEDLVGTVADDPWMRFCYYTLNLLGDPETSLAAKLPVAVTIGPDQTGSGFAEEELYYTFTVTNEGNVDDVFDITTLSTEYWSISLFDSDGVITLSDSDGDGTPDTGTLAPGATKDIVVKVAIPTGATGGTVDITTVTATSSEDVTVSDTATATTTVTAVVIAVTIGPDQTGSGFAGEELYYTFTVTNEGNVDDVFDITTSSTEYWSISLFDSDGVTTLSDSDGDGTPDTGTLAPGATKDIVVKVAIPTGATGGTDTTTVTATSSEDETVSDTATATTTVTATPTETIEFSDSFEEGLGNWTQDPQNDWFISTQRATDGEYSAEVDGRATDATLTMAKTIDLSGKSNATLTFSWFIEGSWDNDEYIKLDISADGGSSWTEKASIDGTSRTYSGPDENQWIDAEIYLGSYMVSNFKIRFRAKVSSSFEDGNVDNVTITSVK